MPLILRLKGNLMVISTDWRRKILRLYRSQMANSLTSKVYFRRTHVLLCDKEKMFDHHILFIVFCPSLNYIPQKAILSIYSSNNTRILWLLVDLWLILRWKCGGVGPVFMDF